MPPSLVNEYAAMPSFHAGWNLLLGVVVFGATQHWLLRALAVAGPAAMMVAVVATANHFVIDVVVGVAIAVACLLVRDALHRRAPAGPGWLSMSKNGRRRDATRPFLVAHRAGNDLARLRSPWQYKPAHPGARLSDREKQELIRGLRATFGSGGG